MASGRLFRKAAGAVSLILLESKVGRLILPGGFSGFSEAGQGAPLDCDEGIDKVGDVGLEFVDCFVELFHF